MQYDVPSTHAPPKALLERSLDASGPRSRVKCCTSGPPRSTPFPVRPSPNRGPKSASGKLLGSYRLACASGIASRTVHETQGLAAGAFLQRALRITDGRTDGGSLAVSLLTQSEPSVRIWDHSGKLTAVVSHNVYIIYSDSLSTASQFTDMS
jgi:hypothetical protein